MNETAHLKDTEINERVKKEIVERMAELEKINRMMKK